MKTQWNEIRRILPGHGGDCTLLSGSEKTAVIDTGMTYCSDRLITLLEEELEGRALDCVLLTHTHYDHAGGVPALKKRWPQVQVIASAHAQRVFQRDGAQREMHRLAKMAATQYLGTAAEGLAVKELLEYPAQLMQVDQVVKMDERIFLGDLTVKVLETPGHTSCSLSYYIEELKIIYHSESTGCYSGDGRVDPSVLTGFQLALESTELCKAQGAEYVISPHFGLVTDMTPRQYFDRALQEIRDLREYLRAKVRRGMEPEDILRDAIWDIWNTRTDSRNEQPLEAFSINMRATIRLIQKEEESHGTSENERADD